MPGPIVRPRTARALLLLAALTYVAVFAARLAIEGTASGVTFLFVIPIAMVAMQHGR